MLVTTTLCTIFGQCLHVFLLRQVFVFTGLSFSSSVEDVFCLGLELYLNLDLTKISFRFVFLLLPNLISLSCKQAKLFVAFKIFQFDWIILLSGGFAGLYVVMQYRDFSSAVSCDTTSGNKSVFLLVSLAFSKACVRILFGYPLSL